MSSTCPDENTYTQLPETPKECVEVQERDPQNIVDGCILAVFGFAWLVFIYIIKKNVTFSDSTFTLKCRNIERTYTEHDCGYSICKYWWVSIIVGCAMTVGGILLAILGKKVVYQNSPCVLRARQSTTLFDTVYRDGSYKPCRCDDKCVKDGLGACKDTQSKLRCPPL